jgi:hypothetical protein
MSGSIHTLHESSHLWLAALQRAEVRKVSVYMTDHRNSGRAVHVASLAVARVNGSWQMI